MHTHFVLRFVVGASEKLVFANLSPKKVLYFHLLEVSDCTLWISTAFCSGHRFRAQELPLFQWSNNFVLCI